ncbi:unnamed protein product [Toxocara canis]|uniref:MFS domain-containing protein n=1 Tax=Toxocara canis TaxID=6265 RepID=A0A183UKZ5_TOXCA|nr:unnamed protein product [Toxocara canis]
MKRILRKADRNVHQNDMESDGHIAYFKSPAVVKISDFQRCMRTLLVSMSSTVFNLAALKRHFNKYDFKAPAEKATRRRIMAFRLFFFVLVQYLSVSQGAIAVGGFFSLGGLPPCYICTDDNLKFNYSSREVKKDPAAVCAQISKCTNLSTRNVWYSIWSFYVLFMVVNSLISPVFNATAITLILESVYSDYRLIQAYAFQWSLGYIFAGLLAHMVRSWRTYLFVANAMVLPAIPLMLLLQESPRFFTQRRKIDNAVRAMNKMAKFNKCSVRFTEEDIRATQAELEKGLSTKKYSFIDLFRSVELAKYSLSQIITGIGMNIISTILLYNVHDLSGNPLLNVSLMGTIRVWTPFAAVLLEYGIKNFGRKTFLVVTQGVVSVCFITMFLLDVSGRFDAYHSIATAAALIGYGVESGFVWMIYKVYTTELFPTVIRTIALSTFSITSLIGSVLSPQLVYLAKFWHPSPYFGAAIITLLATILAVALLPETKGKPLPDTLFDVRFLSRAFLNICDYSTKWVRRVYRVISDRSNNG